MPAPTLVKSNTKRKKYTKEEINKIKHKKMREKILKKRKRQAEIDENKRKDQKTRTHNARRF